MIEGKKIGVDRNMGRKPWALRLISPNALASGSARLMIDAEKSSLLIRFCSTRHTPCDVRSSKTFGF